MSLRRFLPLTIWLVPLAAALIGIALLVRSVAIQGPTVTISFLTAEGLEAGRTKVRYRNVEIGEVKAIRLSNDHSRVLVDVQITESSRNLAVDDARFWVVRPRIGMSGVSGLGTVLSGAYIGMDPGRSNQPREKFIGLETPPTVTSDQNGRRYVLEGDSLGSVDIGSPVYYRRFQVGRVVARSLNDDGKGVTIQVFIDAPYDKFVRADSCWWHASGVDLRLDSGGMKLNTQSLATVVMGGLAFQSRPDHESGSEAPNGTVFPLSDSQAEAMRAPDSPAASVVMKFNQSLRGLSVGAVVDFRGIELGYVTAIDVEYDPKRSEFTMPVTVNLFPNRLGRSFRESLGEGNNDAGKALLQKLVARGLRAQLRTGSLITNQRYIALDIFPNAPRATIDMTKVPLELPTVPNSLEELQVVIADIAKKLDRVPFDRIGTNLDQTLQSANRAFTQLNTELGPQARDTLATAQETFRTAQAALQQDSPLQSDMRQAVSQLNRTLQSLTDLAVYLQEHPESLLRGKPRDEKP
ncbi:MCE family protein [Paraburkholderia guartelaensis]|uniref:MCE family protein n=1 Tax=Paraburkholderia guartelaensis TaxID=2546446 RepID=A0A4R5L4B9_9BURK|nr:MlaD family protein [Paraburkholderia guartelaensis]TDG02687.1 MCE family protein [Paraburkholderia guartelaensis]